jgi:hypothetical protein
MRSVLTLAGGEFAGIEAGALNAAYSARRSRKARLRALNLDGSKTSIAQGLKPRAFSAGCGTTEVVPCYKAFFREAFH